MPIWRSFSAVTSASADRIGMSVDCMITTGVPSYPASARVALARSTSGGVIMSRPASVSSGEPHGK